MLELHLALGDPPPAVWAQAPSPLHASNSFVLCACSNEVILAFLAVQANRRESDCSWRSQDHRG